MAKPGESRCQGHLSQLNGLKRLRRGSAPGDGAASRARHNINQIGAAFCASCTVRYEARRIEVDHRVPLIDGGTDYPDNIQALCHACHVEKTTREARARRSV